MKILVTGGTGFVGSWVVKKLVGEGHEVHLLIRNSSHIEKFTESDGVTTHLGDVTDLNSFCTAAKGMDAIFHLAGVVGYNKKQRPLMDEVNVGGTKNAIEVCKKMGIAKLVYMSSVVAIGASFDGTPFNENSKYNIRHLNLGYFETKHIAEEVVLRAHKNQELEAIIVNPSTIYGPGDATKGSRKSQVKVAQGKMPFYTSGGVNVVNIKDVVEALYYAFINEKTGERYILSGENITIKQLFSHIATAAGQKEPHIYLPNFLVHTIGKIGDTLEKYGKSGPLNSENAWASTLFHWFDSSKAQKELNLRVTPAEQSIRQSVEWMKSNGII